MGEHRTIQTPGVGVAQRGMVAAEQVQTVGQGELGGVGEAVVRSASDDSAEQKMGEEAVPGDLAEADDDADAGQRVDFGSEVDRAVANLLGRGLVAGRGAADYGADPGIAQAQAVVAGDGSGFTGEAEVVEHRVHEVSGAIAGERAAGAVCAVGSGGEAEDEGAGSQIAEARDGTRPVGVILVGTATGFANASAVVAQAGTELAGDDGVADVVRIGSRIWKLAQRVGRLGRRGWQEDGRFAADRFHWTGMADEMGTTHTTAA